MKINTEEKSPKKVYTVNRIKCNIIFAIVNNYNNCLLSTNIALKTSIAIKNICFIQ